MPAQNVDRATTERTRSIAMDHAHGLTTTSQSRWTFLTPIWRFTRHLGEMLVAMFLGMTALGVAEMVLGQPPGDNTFLGGYAYMGLAMTLPMVAWMRRMGHSWRDCCEMSAAMLAPMFAVVLPAALGWLPAMSVMLPAHGAMIAGMVLLMVYRWDRYAHGAHCHEMADSAASR
jgi:hypothetical protein